MRRLPLVALVLVAAGLAACSSEGAAGWTYAPASASAVAPSGSASASPSGSAAPSAPASAAPSASASAAASPSGSAAPSGSPTGEALTGDRGTRRGDGWVRARCPGGSGGHAVHAEFDNQDRRPGRTTASSRTPPARRWRWATRHSCRAAGEAYDVPALAAGEYPFVCEVHPTTMTGTLTVQ